MSANYREHKLERDLKRRVASLEARVVWLEDVLGRVLGQPGAANEASQAPPQSPGAPLDRFLLRTQPMSALAWPMLATAHGELVTLPAQAKEGRPEAMMPFLAYPVGEGDVFIPSRQPAQSAPAIELSPELIDLPPPPPRRLEVCCALELLNPSILQQVTAFWSGAECELRLQRLIGEDFGGRMGLDPMVREELKLLCAISASRAA